jgi:hypothetical protein
MRTTRWAFIIFAAFAVCAASAAQLYPAPVFHWHKIDGTPASGWKVYTYEAGTTTPKDSYSDSSQTVPNTNPVILNSRGEADIYFNGAYKIVIKDTVDVVQDTIDNFGAGVTGTAGADNTNLITNGSFELDEDSDGVADGWLRTVYTGGLGELATNDQYHGAKSLKCVSIGNGGCRYVMEGYIEVSPGQRYQVDFQSKSSVADIRNVVNVKWYDAVKVYISNSVITDNSTTNPTSWTLTTAYVTPPSTARYAKVELFGAHSSDATVGTAWYDDVRMVPDLSKPEYLDDRGAPEISGLLLVNDSTSPNSKITITADVLSVLSATLYHKRLANVSLTADITVTGAGGRDISAAEANSAWYEVWVMAKEDGTQTSVLKLASIKSATTSFAANKLNDSGATFITKQVAVGDLVINDTNGTTTTVTAIDAETQLTLAADIFTASPKNYRVFLNRAPTFPSGYTYKAFVGYGYNDASGNFRNVTQIGATARFDEQVTDASTAPSTTWTTIILSIPPKARSAFVTGAVGTNDANNATVQWRMKGSSSTLGHYMAGVNGTTQRQFNSFMAITDVYQRIEINFNIATASGITLYTDGYILNQ